MIRIGGAVQRSFYFPADLPTAFDYYRDLSRIFQFLPHISLVKKYSDTEFCLLYCTTELHVYRVRLFCDLIVDASEDSFILQIHPADHHKPVSKESGVYSLTGLGYYSSQSIFIDEGNKTKIDYTLELFGDLPTPMAVRFMPKSVLDNIANSITRWRIDEIAEGFIHRSVDAFKNSRRR